MERLQSLTIPSSWNTDINFTDGSSTKPHGTTPVWKITQKSHRSAEKGSPSPFLGTPSMPVNERESFFYPKTAGTLGVMSPQTLLFRLDTSKRYCSQSQPPMFQPTWELCVQTMARHGMSSPMLTETGLSWTGLQSMAQRLTVCDSGVYQIDNQTSTWKQIIPELPHTAISFAIAGNTFYIGTKQNGVLRFQRDGQ